jgi:T5SS/PEP-CTERM-associated repeat protein
VTSGRSHWNFTFDVIPVGETSEDHFWTKRSGGSFDTDANWNPQSVPLKDATRSDNAIFDLRRRYVVDFSAQNALAIDLGAQRTANRLEVLQGDVTLTHANLKVDELDLARPSLRVDTGKLTLASGQITSNSATIGDLHAVGAKIVVNGPDSRWDELGRLRVGGSDGDAGSGELLITDGAGVSSAESRIGAGGAQPGHVLVDGTGSSWTTGNIAVGFSSPGKVDVAGGARVASGVVQAGLGSDTFITVAGADPGGTASSWTGGALELGPHLIEAQVIDGGTMTMNSITFRGGELNIDGGTRGAVGPTTLTSQSLDLREGQMAITSGAKAHFNLPVGIGSLGGPGTLIVEGRSPTGEPTAVVTDALLDVGGGTGGIGRMEVTNGAQIDTGDAFLGTRTGTGAVLVTDGARWGLGLLEIGGDQSHGTLVLSGGNVNAISDIVVSTGGTILGTGNLIVAGDVHVEGGILAPGVAVVGGSVITTPAIRTPFSTAEKLSAAPRTGTLTVEGNLVIGPQGTVETQAANLTADRLVVTGNASLDGKLVLQFKNGFAPKKGMSFEVLQVGGVTTGEFATVETRGLTSGQFESGTNSGSLTLTATEDAVALPTVSVKALVKKISEKRTKPTAVLRFTRKGDTSSELTVPYAIGGTSTNGVDFVMLPGELTIPAKKRSATASIQLVNDFDSEGSETVDVTVLSGPASTPSLSSSARIRIVDDDRPRWPPHH